MEFVSPEPLAFERLKLHAISLMGKRMILFDEIEDSMTALNVAREQVQRALEQGPRAENQYFYLLVEQGKEVGYIWFSVHPSYSAKPSKASLICIYVHKEQRRQGHANHALACYDDLIRKEHKVGISETLVFQDHLAEVSLYTKNHYCILEEGRRHQAKKDTRFLMRKEFNPPSN